MKLSTGLVGLMARLKGVMVGIGLIMGLDGFMRGYGVAFSLFEIIDRVGTQMLG